mgnify:CR=1 FL=1
MIQLVVHLSGILPAKAKMARNLLQGSAIPYHHIKTLKRIRAILFLEFLLELVGWLDVKLIAPL